MTITTKPHYTALLAVLPTRRQDALDRTEIFDALPSAARIRVKDKDTLSKHLSYLKKMNHVENDLPTGGGGGGLVWWKKPAATRHVVDEMETEDGMPDWEDPEPPPANFNDLQPPATIGEMLFMISMLLDRIRKAAHNIDAPRYLPAIDKAAQVAALYSSADAQTLHALAQELRGDARSNP